VCDPIASTVFQLQSRGDLLASNQQAIRRVYHRKGAAFHQLYVRNGIYGGWFPRRGRKEESFSKMLELVVGRNCDSDATSKASLGRFKKKGLPAPLLTFTFLSATVLFATGCDEALSAAKLEQTIREILRGLS